MSNLAKIRDMYGDLSAKDEDGGSERAFRSSNGGEEVIRLGGSRCK